MSSYEKEKELERTREFLEFIEAQDQKEQSVKIEVVGKSDQLENELFGNSEQLKKD